jgi:hypothetical protein
MSNRWYGTGHLMTMSDLDRNPNSIPDWRKYPKPPNFLGIVIGSSIFLLIALVIAYFLLRADGSKMIPHRNPTPNSMVQPFQPDLAMVQNA